MSAAASKERVAKVELGIAGTGSDGSSAQPTDDEQWTPAGALTPPANLEQLASLTGASRTRRSCIAAIAHNTVGLGYELQVKDGHEEEVADVGAHTREAQAELDALSRRDKMLKGPTFGRQLTTVIWDKYECGNGYLEVARNRLTGRISGLFHAPGKRIRRRADRTGWVMLNKAGGSIGEAVSFYDFGSKVAYADDGTPTNRLAKAGLRWDTNELIPFQLYTSESRDYGLPPDAQLAVDYLGDKLAGDTNVGFFGASGVPPTVIFVQGEETQEGETVKIEVPQAFVQQVTDTLRGSPNQRSRVAIVGVPSGFKAQVENLAITSERDMGFIAFRGDNRRAALGAFRLAPVFVADIEDAGKYTAEVERAITKEQVFDPEQQEVQDLLDMTLIAELFPHLALDFDGLAIKNDVAIRESANDLADRGRITNGEYREAHGWPRLPEAADNTEPQPGQVPFGWNAKLMEPQSAKPPLGTLVTPANAPTTQGGLLAKAADDPSLEELIRADFDDAVDEAIRQIHEVNPEAALEPVVVEKDGTTIRITPQSRNGHGARSS